MNNQDVQITLSIYIKNCHLQIFQRIQFNCLNQVVNVDNFKMNHWNQVGVNKFL